MANANNFFNLYLKVNDKEVEQTLNTVGGDLKTLRGYTRNLEEGTEKWHAANKKLAEVEKTYDGMKKNQREFINQTKEATDVTDGSTAAMTEFGENFSSAFSSLRSGDILGFRTAMMGVTAGIRSATKAGLAFLATPIGAGIAALAGIVLATREWANYNKEAAEANRTTQQMTQLSGDALDNARVRAISLEKTFGTDFKQNLEVAKNLVQAFGISYEEAFDKIQNGLIRGGKENGEFMDSLKEYPKLFAQAGFTIEDFQRLVNTGIDLGIYSDKLPDAIKEFSLSVMEETQASRDALENAFGKEFTDKLFKGVQDGSITIKDALGLVAGEAENIGLNAQQAQLLTADLFKGAGEDAGGALVIFEAVTKAINEQEKALTPLQAQIKRVADANEELEQAQNDALKSDRYTAWANDLEVSWTKFKTGWFNLVTTVIDSIADVEVAMSRFRYQVRGFVKDAFTIGKDADWDALGKEADAIQAAKEKIANAQNQELLKEQKKEKENPDTAKTGTNKKKEEDTAASEAAKLREARNKEALTAENKRLEDLDNLQKEYDKKKEDREAASESKQAELDMNRAVKKAESLGAEQKLIEEIKAEYQVKIDEAKLKEEEAELQRIRDFEAKKLEIENELELAKAETEAEKEEIKKEQELEKEEARYDKELEKLEKDLAFLELTENEKNEFKELLENNHQEKMFSIKEKAQERFLAQEKKWMEASAKATEDLEQAKANAAFQGIDVLKSVFGSKSEIYKALFLIEKGMAAAEVVTTTSKSLAAITANTAIANTAAMAASPLTGGMPWTGINTATGIKQAAAVKINAALQLASIAGSALTGFSEGGDTTLFGMGYRDKSGHEVAGVVHTNEYVVPEVVRRDPEVPPILNYLENKRKKKLGLYADGGDTSSKPLPATVSASPDNSMLIMVMNRILQKLDEPWVVDNYFGYEAQQKMQEAQKKLDKIENRSRVKTP